MLGRPNDPPLHELAPIERFSDRAADYVRYRPDYPTAAIDHVLAGLGAPGSLAAADVGAGTGISARMLADRGPRVIAIEPNAEMRAVAAPHPRVTWRDGTAEATGLPAASVDLVLCAQAFHWFRQREAVAEFHRVLRAGGRAAIMWNARDRSERVTLGFTEAIHAVHGEHPAERRPFDAAVFHEAGLFTAPVLTRLPHHQSLDRDGLLGRAISASYVPKDGAGLARLTSLLNELFDRERDAEGLVRLRYRTEVWIATRL